jgi:phosphate transport system protein
MALMHFMRDVERLRRLFLALFSRVEEALGRGIRAFVEQDAELAARVIAEDREIDTAEVEVEEEVLKILALHQPVAQDLRYLVSLLKINRDLERIGDQAVAVAEVTQRLNAQARGQVPPALLALMDRAVAMLRQAFDALIRLDVERARQVWAGDDEADDLARAAVAAIQDEIRRAPHRAPVLMELHELAAVVERIADHSANVAKDVLYVVTGEIVRHRGREFKTPPAAAPAAPPPAA